MHLRLYSSERRKAGKKKYFRFFIILAVAGLSACATLVPLEPVDVPPGMMLLYVFREDAAISMNHKIPVYLNNEFASDILEYDGYYAFIQKPDTYEINFKSFDKIGKPLNEKAWPETLEADKQYMCADSFNFVWGGFEAVFRAEGKQTAFRFEYQGTVDQTDRIESK